MNKRLLIEAVARKNDIPVRAAKANVEATLGIISKTLQRGIPVKLQGFGTFTLRESRPSGRSGRDAEKPRMKPHFIPAAKQVYTQVGKG